MPCNRICSWSSTARRSTPNIPQTPQDHVRTQPPFPARTCAHTDLFVPASTTTPLIVANPSISTRSWLRVFSRSSWPPAAEPRPLAVDAAAGRDLRGEEVSRRKGGGDWVGLKARYAHTLLGVQERLSRGHHRFPKAQRLQSVRAARSKTGSTYGLKPVVTRPHCDPLAQDTPHLARPPPPKKTRKASALRRRSWAAPCAPDGVDLVNEDHGGGLAACLLVFRSRDGGPHVGVGEGEACFQHWTARARQGGGRAHP
jgi:hypothetical protein